MSQEQPNSPQQWPRKRRSQRLPLSVPVVAYKMPKAGRPFFQGAHTLSVSAHGALISLATGISSEEKLMLRHAVTGEEQECRVIFIQKKVSGPTEVGIEFRQPAPNFWGIAFPPGDWVRTQ
jgi:hypothetical protein